MKVVQLSLFPDVVPEWPYTLRPGHRLHGTRDGFIQHGCRCPACKAAIGPRRDDPARNSL